METYGLIGKNIDYSFSRNYFTNKFKILEIKEIQYLNFDINKLEDLKDLLKKHKTIGGLNVTIPYKKEILSYLQSIDNTAKVMEAVNTIKIEKNGNWVGYNTDVIGFRDSLLPLLQDKKHGKALVLGTGGASAAITFVLNELGIDYVCISRTKKQPYNVLSYEELNVDLIKIHTLIINTTPLGTFPHIDAMPPISYEAIGNKHLCYDLIYNPKQTAFLKKAQKQGAQTKNGLEMLILQAEAAWRIWNKPIL